MVSVNIENIRKDLSCPICLEIMKNPVIVKEVYKNKNNFRFSVYIVFVMNVYKHV